MTDPDGDGVYEVTLPLAPGTYQYKFVVDGNWLQDPKNPEGTDDGFGGQNSVLTVPAGGGAMTAGGGKAAAAVAPAEAAPTGGVTVLFRYTPVISGVQHVFLAGDFNGWSDTATPMQDDDQDGTWTVAVPIGPGDHQYKFVVDGDWQADPENPNGTDDGFGGQNSVLHVPAGVDTLKAWEAAAATGGGSTTGVRRVKFSYAAGKSATNVFLAGTFNDWNDSKTRMTDPDGDGVFTVTLLLQPGTYQYKFVVDGTWHQDPNNPKGTDDGFGGQNSVLEVDDSFPAVEIGRGDGAMFTDDIEPRFDYSTCNPLTETEIEITAKAHLDDVEQVELRYGIDGGKEQVVEMTPAESDPAYRYYRARVTLPSKDAVLEYRIVYRDGGQEFVLGRSGFGPDVPPFRYTAATHPPFVTPAWAQGSLVYQIFPERFRNGDTANDPDFSEPWYQGVNTLPPGGKTNGEYFHLVQDWYDWSGLKHSPYRTDGKPDYYSFYGGDIAGVRQELDYLQDLGVEVIYFNPLTQGVSNHKYDPVDYRSIDPHFATPEEFRAFVDDCHQRGIRVIVDMAFNHTGNWHFAFRDCVEKGQKSKYWNWYEWKRWPLPKTRDFKASDYYACWWGFGLHPELNYDLSRPQNQESAITDISQARPNWDVVNYVLDATRWWLTDMDVDGFRLDVPNEVPFWFWKLFREACDEAKPDVWLVGEIWGNAGSWVGPDCFDSVMNYKFFRDPVMDFIGKGRIDAATFDRQLAPGRSVYPPQSVAVMMNLIDSHDTVRFLTTTGDVRRLMLAALFEMTYVGMPHVWYGDEIGMEGGKDPDCRRPFDWRYEKDPRKKALREFYGLLGKFRRDHDVLKHGEFVSVLAQGRVYGYARRLGDQVVLVLLNAGPRTETVTVTPEMVAEFLPEGASGKLRVLVGPERFPESGAEASPVSGETVDLRAAGGVTVTLPGVSGVVMGRSDR